MRHAFPCGTLALDFVGTLRARRNDEPTEMLTTVSDLDAWFVESGLMPDGVDPDEPDLTSALELREAIYALAWARLHERPLPEDAIAVVNTAASGAPLRPVLSTSGWSRTGAAEEALCDLARQAIEVIGGEQSALLRECGRPECTQIYLDHSRGHRREWCSMATCGSRMKAQAYRARQRTNTDA